MPRYCADGNLQIGQVAAGMTFTVEPQIWQMK